MKYLIVRHCVWGWQCTSHYRGARLHHSHREALRRARSINRALERKEVKVVMIRGHFSVVDHTWERND